MGIYLSKFSFNFVCLFKLIKLRLLFDLSEFLYYIINIVSDNLVGIF